MTEAGTKLTSGTMLRGAVALVREHPGAVLVWMLVSALVQAGSALALRPVFIDFLIEGNRDGNILSFIVKTLALVFLDALVMIVLFAASQRIVLRPQERSFAGLRLGWDELRLLGICLLLGLVFVLVLLAASILIGVLVGILAVLASRRESLPAFGLMIKAPLILLMVWAQVRISLSLPLTMMRRRAVIDDGWKLSRGRFWTLFGGYFAIFAVMWVAGTLVQLLSGDTYIVELLRSGFDFHQAQAVADAHLIRMLVEDVDAMMILSWVLGGVVGGLSVALTGGAAVTAARALDGEDDIAAS